MEQHGDLQRPAVALFLPEARTPAAVIEMPEHAWRSEKVTDPQAWFYKMYTADPSERGEVAWSVGPGTLSFRMQTPARFDLEGTAKLGDDGVAIEYDIRSAPVSTLASVQAVTCVKLYRPFTDVFLERTYVHLPSGLDPIASDRPDRMGQNAEEWLPCRYIARVAKDAAAVPYRSERQDGITRHFKSRAADAAFLATESEPKGWTACTHTVQAESVFTNPARTCHHTDPIGRGITNGRAHLQLKVYLVKGTPADAWRIVSREHGAGRA